MQLFNEIIKCQCTNSSKMVIHASLQAKLACGSLAIIIINVGFLICKLKKNTLFYS